MLATALFIKIKLKYTFRQILLNLF